MQLVDAALAVVERDGFGALSLRSVARELSAGPMTLYTYVASSDELAALVVDRLIDDAVRMLRWPRSARAVLQLFARELDRLIAAHPAMVEAYCRGLVREGSARRFAVDVRERLVGDGLPPDRARDVYLAVHALVLGFALLRTGPEPAAVLNDLLAQLVDKVLDDFGLQAVPGVQPR